MFFRTFGNRLRHAGMDFSNTIRSKLLPALAAFALFFVVSAAYFAPQFRGEALPQHDVIQYEGMAKDISDMRAATGEDPQWTGGMFGGMPAYLINVAYPAQLVKRTVGQVVKIIDTPAGFLFFAMVSMWLMLLIVGINPWVGIVAALAYGLSTYFLLIIGAGHVTKMWALVYAPLMMGGAWMTLRGNVWCGAALTGLAASLEIGANHPQITYYFLVAMAAFWISEGILSFREGRLRDFSLRTAALVAAGILAVGSNFSPLWYTARHSKETIRGGSELAATAETSKNGLALDYATAWSYGKAETLNLLVPDFMGRESGTTFPADGQTAAVLNDYGLRGAAQQLSAYWGTQPYTGGPTYLGAAAVFLAALGIALARGRNKWWIIAACVVMILLAWGRNLMGFTEFAFKYLPGYNKFRTVSMTLVVVQWAVPLLGALALMRLWKGEIPRERLLRALAWAAGITGGACLLLAVAGGSLFDFGRAESADYMTDTFRHIFESNNMRSYIDRGMDIEWAEATADAMAADRAAMMRTDAWRSLVMILLAAGGVALFALRRINRYVLTGLQRRHDLLFPPLGGRLPRGEAGPLPGSDRPLPFQRRRRSARHAQHALPDRSGQGGAARSAAPHDGLRSGVVRRQRHLRPLGAGGNRPAGQDGPPHDSGGVGAESGEERIAAHAPRHLRLRPDRAHGVPPELPQIRIHAPRRGGGGVLGDFLRPGLEGLCRRRGKPLLPGRLRPAGDDAARRHAHRRMAVPRTGLDGRRRRDARGVARDPAGSRRGAGLLF